MKILLNDGDRLVVGLVNGDGEFVIDFNSKKDMKLTIEVDMPDSTGREGVIYSEEYGWEGGVKKINTRDGIFFECGICNEQFETLPDSHSCEDEAAEYEDELAGLGRLKKERG